MATGIVSIGLRESGFDVVAHSLLAFAVLAYVFLAVLYVLRWVRYRPEVMRDLRDPEKSFGYFTIVAGTGVLAVGLLDTRFSGASVALMGLAALIWFVPGLSTPIGMLAVLSWSVGALLYAGIAVLIILRIVHLGLSAAEFEPTYWVSMGALAISVVAGTGIIDMTATPMVQAAGAFIGGTVISFWCFAAWLIPMLLAAGVWRHILNRVPLRYTPGLWSMVFPLGMFAVASMTER
ncbi:hypothetical protein F8O05_05725 [Gulosibacter chungangensis]|uniref:C4-dicarboxylate ABC transporter n=2 Tax=Gulosibacter chungangensis TaxID=979746 RepID=A0A7J5BEG6_9MICO|nr:hypothetical protein F8O05_05725 [Gulosibacter chungangensis]